jgi:NhaP-type Na+/H+ or K+/H+ antiporter
LKFDDEVFFNFILPPIIFAAGYNLKKKSFFKYLMYILVFGVVGTIATFGCVAPLTYMANESDLFGTKFTLKEILLFASVISATDTVAALTFVKESTDPKLFSVLFGEGVLNDAVCIVLYKIIRTFKSKGI